jgi:acyl dehydratase
MGVNYGLDKVRFPAPVKVDARVRARRSLAAVEQKAPNTLQLKQVVTIEIEGEAKPACVAESLTRLIYAD